MAISVNLNVPPPKGDEGCHYHLDLNEATSTDAGQQHVEDDLNEAPRCDDEQFQDNGPLDLNSLRPGQQEGTQTDKN
jgi:hypothetical protein